MCGDMAYTEEPFRDAPGFKEHFQLFEYISTGDYLLPGAKDAIRYYQKRGMKVTVEIPPGTGHCDFYEDMDRILDERVAKALVD
jgi:hypothetical protein